MKNCIIGLFLSTMLFSCKSGKDKIVDKSFTDSLLTHFSLPSTVKSNEEEIQFWKSRIDPKLTGIVNESKYAAALAARFHMFGNIQDIRTSDSTLYKINKDYNYKEAAPNLTLTAHSILQHRFKEADAYLQKAKEIGIKQYESLSTSFDVDFELGRYSNAALDVKLMKPVGDYGYYFRRSKLNHLNGELDSSISAMLKAAGLSENVAYLEQVALSNAADLYIHAGELQKANDLYVKCIRMNSVDFHSIMGLGWIALVHDKNDSLAEQLFLFVHSKSKLPDPVFKLSQMADGRGDSALQKKYALEFENIVTDAVYGNMYNKYLVELYTGILNEPSKAVAITKRELENSRATPQTYAWYAWSLAAGGKTDEAYKIYEQYVSGKPLEGIELYWMGKLMQLLKKGYNAQEFFKAAYKNKYDLSPGMVKDLEKELEK